jgi:hypothetical protein
MSPDRTWKSLLLLTVLALHLWAGWTLAHFHPERKPAASHARMPSPSAEPLLVLTFTSRADAEPTSPSHQSRAKRRPLARQPSASSASQDSVAAVDVAVPVSGTQAALDLTAPADPSPSFPRPDPLQRRSGLEFQATRYDKAWIAEGTLTDVVARKSTIAGILLGAMGALTKPCTELQRARYDRNCVSDQYRHPGYGE